MFLDRDRFMIAFEMALFINKLWFNLTYFCFWGALESKVSWKLFTNDLQEMMLKTVYKRFTRNDVENCLQTIYKKQCWKLFTNDLQETMLKTVYKRFTRNDIIILSYFWDILKNLLSKFLIQEVWIIYEIDNFWFSLLEVCFQNSDNHPMKIRQCD